MTHIAVFISSHGFGHAARASAVMAAIHRLQADCFFHILTETPEWFFENSFIKRFDYRMVQTDIGMVQQDPLHEDVSATLDSLDRFLPYQPDMVEDLRQTVQKADCQLVLCDIAPLGIVVARAAGIPSILVENFTWDWIYETYTGISPKFARHIAYLKEIFGSADHHIKAEPYCDKTPADLTTKPISRNPLQGKAEIREILGIPEDSKVVTITMGGIPDHYPFLDKLSAARPVRFIIPGIGSKIEIRDNLVLIPHQSAFYHPDLIHASNAVIGKVGYSTLAEIYHAGIPFGYIARPEFRESPKLLSFIGNRMQGMPIDQVEFRSGAWIPRIEELLALPSGCRNEPNGADQAAKYLVSLLDQA